MAMGECSAYSSLQADSNVKFAAWPTSWRSPGTDRLSLKLSQRYTCHMFLYRLQVISTLRYDVSLCTQVYIAAVQIFALSL